MSRSDVDQYRVNRRQPYYNQIKHVSLVLVALALGALAGCSAAQRMTGFGDPAMETPFDKIEAKPCSEVALDAKKMVREYWEAGYRDSALAAFVYWSDQCGVTAATYRTSIVLHIAAGEFDESQLDQWVIENIIRYRHRNDPPKYDPWVYYQPEPEDRTLEQFTKRAAREVLAEQEEGSVEQLLCECLAGDCDSLFVKIKEARYAGTRLRRYYDEEVRRVTDNRTEGHFSLYSGYWMPQGDNDVLGDHPVLGSKLGGKFDGWAMDCVAEIRLLDAEDPFTIEHNDTVITSEGFLGYYVGFEVGRELFRLPSHEFQLRVGAGFDGFRYGEVKEGVSSQKVHAFNANVGFFYKYYLKAYNLPYIGIEGLYNFVDYERNGGDAVGGNVLEFRVAFGWSGNVLQNERLRDLRWR